MSDQPTDKPETQAAPVAAEAAKEISKAPEPTAALAALAEAVSSAEKAEIEARPAKAQPAPSSSKPAAAPKPSPAVAKPPPPRAAEPAAAARRYPLRAAGLALAIGLGVAGGAYALSRPVGAGASESVLRQWTEAAGASLRQNQDDVTRLSGDMRALKVAVESLKEGLDRSKGDGARGQIVERLDRTDRATGEIAAKLAKLSEQLDRVERGEKEGVAKITLLNETKAAQLNERFERVERQVTAAANTIAAIQTAPKPTPAPVPEPDRTASLAPPKPDPKTVPVEGFIVRDVYDGMALIEGRNKRLHEVSPGSNLPGVGRIDSIERRGKGWVVLTAKGMIPMERW